MKQNAVISENVMKLEVFILGGQRIDQKRKKGWWRGRRERIEKESRDAWTDSTIVLSWLVGNPRRFKTYLGNRISSIVDQTPSDRWNHVMGIEEHSDLRKQNNKQRQVSMFLILLFKLLLSSFYLVDIDEDGTPTCS